MILMVRIISKRLRQIQKHVSLTTYLPSWSRVLLEKFRVTKLVKTYSPFTELESALPC